MLEQLTYVQIGDRLNISPEGARAIVKRNRLPRSHDKNGKTLVAIDLDELQHKPLLVRSPRRLPVSDVVATLKARIEQLEAELAAEQQRSAGHLAHYEHERERADLLARGHEKVRNPTQEPPLASASWASRRRPPNTARLVALAAPDRLTKFPAEEATRPLRTIQDWPKGVVEQLKFLEGQQRLRPSMTGADALRWEDG